MTLPLSFKDHPVTRDGAASQLRTRARRGLHLSDSRGLRARHSRGLRTRALAAMLTLLIACLGLSACGNDTPLSATVTGDFGGVVSINLEGQQVPESTRVHVVTEGLGKVFQDGSPVLYRATSFDSRTGQLLVNSDNGHITLGTYTEKSLGADLYKTLDGVKEGSRLVVMIPRRGDGKGTWAEIVVVDLLYTLASGKPVHYDATGGLPPIATGDNGGPILTGTGTIPDTTKAIELISGLGQQVEKDTTIVFNYSMYDAEGHLIDSSWSSQPQVAKVSTMMAGLQYAITDMRVGSRVLALIPSAEAQGTGNRYVFVDILAALK